jgi:hypothetical protein
MEEFIKNKDYEINKYFLVIFIIHLILSLISHVGKKFHRLWFC